MSTFLAYKYQKFMWNFRCITFGGEFSLEFLLLFGLHLNNVVVLARVYLLKETVEAPKRYAKSV